MRKRGAATVAALCGLLARGALAYPIAEERKLGERFSLEAASQLQVIREPAVVEYVEGLGQRIVSHLEAPQPFEYRFYVVRDSQLNAFAVPGGFVYVNSGLLLRVGNESELAGVLSHEIGHTHAHHIVRQEEKSRFLNYAALAGMLLSVIQPAIGAAAMGANATAQLKYQREFEQEADYLGVRYMREAGFDPHGMLSFMKRVWDEQRTMPIDQIPPYMLSHPMTDERINHLEAALRGIAARPGWNTPTFALERVQTIVRALTGDRLPAAEPGGKIASAGPQARALYGIARLYQGDAAAALVVLESASEQGVSGLEYDIALARYRTGDLDGARRVLRGGVETDPQDGLAWGLLGKVLLARGEYAEAGRALERAAALSPAIDEIEYDLGQAYGRGGDGARGLYHLARALEMRGDVEQALAQYEKVTKQLPPESRESVSAQERIAVLREISQGRVIGMRR